MAVSLGGVPSVIQNLIQQNVLERQFRDALFPALLYRAGITAEEFEGQRGESKIMTRDSLLPVSTVPLVPGIDPVPQALNREQWLVEADQYGEAIDTHMPTSATALARLFLRHTKALGLNAGQTLNRLIRDRLFRAYLSGNTNTTVLAAIGAGTIHVASINGFTEQLVNGRPTAVSAANAIPITFTGGLEPANTVVAAVPDNPLLPFGPGTLTLGAVLTAGVAAREGVLGQNRAIIYRVGGGASVDNIGAADVLQFTDISNAVAILDANNNSRHMDGFYHCHMPPEGKAQVYTDNAWQRLFESMPDHVAYRNYAMGVKLGCVHYQNNESPSNLNTGTLSASGAGASFSSSDIGADVINNAGIRIGRAIITADESALEYYIPEDRYITSEAGVTGKVGNFTITNNGLSIMTDRIRHTVRSPLDRLQQVIGQAWSWSGDFAIPSDQLTGGNARFKRAVVLEFALG